MCQQSTESVRLAYIFHCLLNTFVDIKLQQKKKKCVFRVYMRIYPLYLAMHSKCESVIYLTKSKSVRTQWPLSGYIQ